MLDSGAKMDFLIAIETGSQSRGPVSRPGDEMLTRALSQCKQTREAALRLPYACSVFSKQPLSLTHAALVLTTKHTSHGGLKLIVKFVLILLEPTILKAKKVGKRKKGCLVTHSASTIF